MKRSAAAASLNPTAPRRIAGGRTSGIDAVDAQISLATVGSEAFSSGLSSEDMGFSLEHLGRGSSFSFK